MNFIQRGEIAREINVLSMHSVACDHKSFLRSMNVDELGCTYPGGKN